MEGDFCRGREPMTAVPGACRRWRSRALRAVAVVCLGGWVSIGVGTAAQEPDVNVRQVDAAPAPLTEIRAIRTLMPEVARRSRRVLIRGTVTYINEREPAGIIVHDGRAGVFVRYGRKFVRRPGRSTCVPATSSKSKAIRPRRGSLPMFVRRTSGGSGVAPLPSPKRVSYAALSSGGVRLRLHRSDRRRTARVVVRVREDAVRRHCRRRRCRYARGSGTSTTEDLTRFIDARVRLRGNAGTLYTPARQVRGDLALRRPHGRRRRRDGGARSLVPSDSRDRQLLHPSRHGSDRSTRAAARDGDGHTSGAADDRRGHHDAFALARRASQGLRSRRDERGADRDRAVVRVETWGRHRSRRIPDRQLHQAANSECRHPPGRDRNGSRASRAFARDAARRRPRLRAGARRGHAPCRMWPHRPDVRWS